MWGRKSFSNERFILAEGPEDAQFIRELIALRGGMPEFDISSNGDLNSAHGIAGFRNAVMACEPITGFTSVSSVILLADNDDDPLGAFRNVCGQVEQARVAKDIKRQWGEPAQTALKAVGDPSLAVWLWPAAGTAGCLETLLWKVVEAVHPNDAACVNAACACAHTNTWPIAELDKARVRCFLALKCRPTPSIRLSKLWKTCPELIPLDHPEFDSFAAFLRSA
jgi:hypothetical protein